MPAVIVDGTDVLDTYEGASKIVEGVRAGNGPAVIECKCCRWRGHFEGDQCAYRDQSVTEKWMQERDCVKNFEQDLVKQGILTDEQIGKMRQDFDREMEEAIARAEAAPEMTADEIYDFLYV